MGFWNQAWGVNQQDQAYWTSALPPEGRGYEPEDLCLYSASTTHFPDALRPASYMPPASVSHAT